MKALALLSIAFATVMNDRPASNANPGPVELMIEISTTEQGSVLRCTKGCAWTDLTFTINPDIPQTITEMGMASTADRVVDTDLAPFSFTITRTAKGILLEGGVGTAWERLEWSCAKECTQLIDQYGMVGAGR